MEITVFRYLTTSKSTSGLVLVNGEFLCYSLEDPYRLKKVPGETRIGPGRFRVGLQTVGRVHEKLQRRFYFHQGALHIKKVPGFEGVLIHPGNSPLDTAGCLLVGEGIRRDRVLRSTSAYTLLYKSVLEAMDLGDEVWITLGGPYDLLRFNPHI